MTSLYILLCLFIHKSSSKQDRDEFYASHTHYTHQFCEDVGEFYRIFTFRFSFWKII